jgi:hypothetical protein
MLFVSKSTLSSVGNISVQGEYLAVSVVNVIYFPVALPLPLGCDQAMEGIEPSHHR